MPFVEIIPLSSCREGAGTFVERDGYELAVFWLTNPDRVVVFDNACPHAGGNLSAGEVHDGLVTCRWHQWEFDLSSGVCPHSVGVRVRRYRAELREGMVWVDFPD